MFNVTALSSWYTENNNILNSINFNVNSNEILGIVGVNGAGKSTLINTICGIHPKYSVKSIKFMNNDIAFDHKSFVKNRYPVFTEDESFEYWSFEQYIKYCHETYDVPIDNQLIDELVSGFSFEKYRTYKLKDLSTGNKKKCFLITAFSLKLPLLIFDEPLDGLDFESSEYLYKKIVEYKEFGSIIMSSHIAESIQQTCDRMIILRTKDIVSFDIDDNTDVRKIFMENKDV